MSGDARRNVLLTGRMRTRDLTRCLLLIGSVTQVEEATLKDDMFVFYPGFGRVSAIPLSKRHDGKREYISCAAPK